MALDLNKLIASAVAAYTFQHEDVEIREWDRVSPINDVPARDVKLDWRAEGFGPCPDARAVILRIRSLDVVLVIQFAHPETNSPLRSDADVEFVLNYVTFQVYPALVASEEKLRAALVQALTVRILRNMPET